MIKFGDKARYDLNVVDRPKQKKPILSEIDCIRTLKYLLNILMPVVKRKLHFIALIATEMISSIINCEMAIFDLIVIIPFGVEFNCIGVLKYVVAAFIYLCFLWV